jgi:hypothetical protein
MNLASFVRVSGLRLSGFDYFVFAGAAVNLLVIGCLIGYSLFAG